MKLFSSSDRLLARLGLRDHGNFLRLGHGIGLTAALLLVGSLGATLAQTAPEAAPVPPANPSQSPAIPKAEDLPAPDIEAGAKPAEGQAAVSTPAPAPAPARAESLREIVNSLSQGDIQEAIAALRTNYINQDALTEQELNRAALEGLILRLDQGAILEVENAAVPVDKDAVPFLAEILDGRVGYIRLGPLNEECLPQLDAALETVNQRNLPAAVLDLRGTPPSSDYTLAEQVVSRFSVKGKPLFTIRRPGARQEQIFTSKSDPTYTGFVVALVNSDTAGAVETIAGAIRQQTRSLLIGARTQGRAVEYSNVQLSNGRLMKVATGKIVLPTDKPIFPDGVMPDLLVELTPEDQASIFRQSREGGMSQFVFETERPRLNEAALVAGTNPSIDAYQESRKNGPAKVALRDSVLQRAMDVVTSIQVLEYKTPIAKPEPAPAGGGKPAPKAQ